MESTYGPCPNCGDATERPCPHCVAFGAHDGPRLHGTTTHRAPDEITAREIIEAVAPEHVARVEQTGGGVATVFVMDEAGRDVLAIGPGRYEWSDPLASVFWATFDTILGFVDDDSAEPYIFHDWTDATIRAVVAQALYDLTLRDEEGQ